MRSTRGKGEWNENTSWKECNISIYHVHGFIKLQIPTVENYGIIEETPVEVEDTETDEPIIQEVQTMELQPIKEYKNYVTSGKRVFGINRDSLEEITILSSEGGKILFEKFFVIDGELCLSVIIMESIEPDGEPSGVEHFFVQSSGDMMEVEKSAFFNMPESMRIEYPKDKLFTIKKTIYGELETSTVIRGTLQEAYLKIDGCARANNGMWFSVPESYKSRLQGVYFWPDDAVKSRILVDGRIW